MPSLPDFAEAQSKRCSKPVTAVCHRDALRFLSCCTLRQQLSLAQKGRKCRRRDKYIILMPLVSRHGRHTLLHVKARDSQVLSCAHAMLIPAQRVRHAMRPALTRAAGNSSPRQPRTLAGPPNSAQGCLARQFGASAAGQARVGQRLRAAAGQFLVTVQRLVRRSREARGTPSCARAAGRQSRTIRPSR